MDCQVLCVQTAPVWECPLPPIRSGSWPTVRITIGPPHYSNPVVPILRQYSTEDCLFHPVDKGARIAHMVWHLVDPPRLTMPEIQDLKSSPQDQLRETWRCIERINPLRTELA